MDVSIDYYEFKNSFKSDKEWKKAYANLAEEEVRRLIRNCENSSYLAQTGMISEWRKLHNMNIIKQAEE